MRNWDPKYFGPWIRDGKIRIRDKHTGSATSVADPKPGSGAFLTPGSGIPDPKPIFLRA
jgi:hypothetical protein